MIEETHEVSVKKSTAPTHWPSILQFAFSTLVIFVAMSLSVVMLIGGIIQLTSDNPNEAARIFTYALTALFVSLLLLPSVVYSFSRIVGREVSLGKPWRTLLRVARPKWLIILFPLLLVIGHFANKQEPLSWVLLPPVHVLAVSIPVSWLAWLGIRKLQKFSSQRLWGIFNTGLVMGPAIIFTLEIIVFIVVIFVAVFAFAFNPQNILELEQFAGGFDEIIPGSPEEMAVLTHMLNNPSVIFFMLFFLSVIVPLIEEAFKPIGVWFLAGRNPTPGDGFVAGIISGMGYALFENLGNISLGLSWSTLVLARVGTSVMHIFTAGLIGYTLALAWKENRYLRLGAAYVLAVVIHGLWNAFTILSTVAGLEMEDSILPYYLVPTGGIALVVLASGVFVLLILSNRKVRRESDGMEKVLQTAENPETKE
ncbi:MAG: PrsW family glutamic-type intramembrane protease [Anaerolineales bacterium]|jgi:hypothetical protein